MPTDQQAILEAGLPFIALIVSYIIQQNHFSKIINTTIAGITVLLSAVASLLIQHKFTGNVLADFLLVASVAAALQIGALAPLTQWLKNIGDQTPKTQYNMQAVRPDERQML